MCFRMRHKMLSSQAVAQVALLSCFAFYTSADPGNLDPNAPLGLPRLSSQSSIHGSIKLASEAFEVEPMTGNSEVECRIRYRKGKPYFALAAGENWARPIRKFRAEVSYVTFSIYGSIGTELAVGGLRFRLNESSVDKAFAAVEVQDRNGGSERWKGLNYEIPLQPYGGLPMAALQMVTVKLQSQRGSASVWIRNILVCSDAGYIPEKNARVEVAAGPQGAWVCGIVYAEENPLYVDANKNDIPDEFELRHRGSLLTDDCPFEDIASVHAAWLGSLSQDEPAEFILTTPLPDSFPDWCRPSTEPVHGMPDSYRFRDPNP